MLQGLLLLGLVVLAQEKPPSEKDVLEVLRKVKEGVAEEKRAEELRALGLGQQAETARREGRLKDALTLARRAERLFPGSPELRRLVRSLEAEEAASKQRERQLATARQRLDEALDAAEKLYRSGEAKLARELAEAVVTVAARFPVGVEVVKAVTRAETFLKDPAQSSQPKEPPAEQLPVAPLVGPPPPPPPLHVPSRKLLARLMNVDWQQVTLLEALQQIAGETGVQLRLDPMLTRMRVFETRRLTWQAQNEPAERLLRHLMDQVGTDFLHMNNGQVYITTKREALAMIMERRSPPAAVPQPPPRRVANGPEKIPEPPQEDSPVYLQSGKAFLAHIDSLLQPVPSAGEGKP
jgi:hypothetical protein